MSVHLCKMTYVASTNIPVFVFEGSQVYSQALYWNSVKIPTYFHTKGCPAELWVSLPMPTLPWPVNFYFEDIFVSFVQKNVIVPSYIRI